MQRTSTIYSPYTIDVPGREDLAGRNSHNPGAAARLPRRETRLRPSDFCFVVAGLAALGGMTLGIVMGIRQDFTLAPAHAHLNLLGWVTMALYGLYHRGIGRAGGWLAWTQVLTGAIGAIMMSGGLAVYLQSGDHSFFLLVVAGSLFAFLGMALFVITVLTDLLGGGPSLRGSDRFVT